MCGFSGFINFLKNDSNNSSILQKMGMTLKLRGPDEETFFQDDNLSFVFRRLSIIDVEGGSQPIWNEDKSIFVAVNGEIYNYQELKQLLKQPHTFRTDSDSEIIVHLYEEYGTELFTMLNGMFAIVIWDQTQKKLILARDRLGIKPLYYIQTNDTLIFASELKALLMHPQCPRELNWQDLNDTGVQQKFPVSSYVKGICHFPAGFYATYNSHSKLELKEYWAINHFFNTPDLENSSVTKIKQQYSQLLKDSIHKRLMSDVPIGLFLSGGIDSSLIASILAEQSNNVHCFTVVERTTYRSGDVELARKIAKSLKLPFYPILFDSLKIAKQFQLSDLENLICLMESPRFDPEWLFKSELHRAAKAQVPGLKVILLGQGADEFCGGYSTYLGSKWSNWNDYIAHNVNTSIKQQVNIEHHIPPRFSSGIAETNFIDHNISAYNTKMKMLTYQLQHFNLWHEDRTSSYHSIESRVPFLDHRLVELLAGIPEKHHQELFWNKSLIRSTSESYLPDYPQEHPKVPFFVTDDISSIEKFTQTICHNIYPTFREKYSQNNKALFNIETMEGLYQQVSSNHKQNSHAAWQLIEMMSISIFAQFLLHTETYLDSYFFINKPPFPMLNESDWPQLITQYNEQTNTDTTPTWTLESLINLPANFEILNPLTEADDATILILANKNDNAQRLSIAEEHYWIVMLLDEMGRHRNSPKDILFWSQKAKVPPEQLVSIADNLIQGGFIERVEQ